MNRVVYLHMNTKNANFDALESRTLLSGASLSVQQIRNLYGLPKVYRAYGDAGKGAGVTVAVVIAGANPTIAAEMTRFDHKNHLAAVDLTVDDLGTEGATDPAWSAEAFADVALIHAVSPLAHIDLVEVGDTGYDDLMAADQYAANLPGVSVVENGWGGPEFSGEPFYDRYLANPNVVFVAAVGDYGEPDYPAVSPDVVAVGGVIRTGGYSAPMAMNGASIVYPGRTTPDVTMVANTMVSTGTSAASAIFAGLMGDVQAERIERGEATIGVTEVRSLMDSASGDRLIFRPVHDEAGAGMPSGLGLVRLLTA